MKPLYRILYGRREIAGMFPGRPKREVEYAEVRESTTDAVILAAYDWPRATVQERADAYARMFLKQQKGQSR